MPNRIEVECPRCRGMRGHMRDGIFISCITCQTKGKIMVASQAEARRVEAMINNPKKIKTKQREKAR
jgi:hypothetical protein